MNRTDSNSLRPSNSISPSPAWYSTQVIEHHTPLPLVHTALISLSDNEKRASRLQQLVDSMADMQTDVKNIGVKMDEKNVKYRPAIDKLLKAHGMDSVDDVINKAMAEMTPDERKAFEAVRSELLSVYPIVLRPDHARSFHS